MSTSQQRAGSGPGADAHLGMAVTAGIISQAQADQIAALTPPAPPNGAVAPETGRARRQAAVSPATEVVGYLGATLAMAGVTTLVADSWSDLTSGSRIALLASVATAFLVAGLLVRDEEVDDAAMRLRSFLLLLSTAAAAGAAGLLGDDVLAWSPEGTARLVGATVAVQSALLWARRATRPAQHLTTFAGLLILLVGLVVELDSAGAAGVALWLFAAAWLLAGWREPPAPVGAGPGPRGLHDAGGLPGGGRLVGVGRTARRSGDGDCAARGRRAGPAARAHRRRRGGRARVHALHDRLLLR